jgi:glutathione peroxidase-family protein
LTFLIDRSGRIAAVYQGVIDKADIKSNIQQLLKEPLRH